MDIRRLERMEEIDYATLESLLGEVPLAGLIGAKARNYVEKVLEKGYAFVIVEERAVYGWIAFYANDYESRTAYLSTLAVDPKLRGRGWGTRLMNAFLAVSKENGMKEISFNVLKTNEGAIRFYRRLGADVVGQGITENKYLMKGPVR